MVKNKTIKMIRSVFWLSFGLLILCLLGSIVTVMVKAHNPEAYPSKLIDKIMDKHIHSFEGAFESDSLDGDHDQVKLRNDISSDTFICESKEETDIPKEGITKSNSSVIIVNTAARRQSVRIEKCRNEGERCNFCDGDTVTVCKQLYHYQRLVVMNLVERRPYYELIKLPSSCKCATKV